MIDTLTSVVSSIVYDRQGERVRATWRVLVPVLAGFVAFNLAGGGVATLGVTRGQMMLVSFGASTLVALGLLIFSSRYLDKRPVPEYGYHLSRDWALDLGAGVVCGMGVIGVTFLISHATGTLRVTGSLISNGPAVFPLIAFFIAFVGVTFYEEFLFRGLFITNAAEGVSEHGFSDIGAVGSALLLSTIAFALVHLPSAVAHGSNVVLVATKTGLLGGLLGVAYILTGELALPMGLHLGVNYALMNVFGIGATGFESIPSVIIVERLATGLWGPVHGIPIIVATLGGYAFVLMWTYWRQDTLSCERSTVNTSTITDS
jgi:hypothetical protein